MCEGRDLTGAESKKSTGARFLNLKKLRKRQLEQNNKK